MIGDPLETDYRGLGKHGLNECSKVAAVLRRSCAVKRLQQYDASKAAVLELLQKQSWVHFVCHGIQDIETRGSAHDTSFGALVLGKKSWKHDGLLKSQDIQSLKTKVRVAKFDTPVAEGPPLHYCAVICPYPPWHPAHCRWDSLFLQFA